MISYDQHPLSAAFPLMSDAEFAELREDIAANGLQFPIVLFEEQVLDGWHRMRACLDTGSEPKFKLFKGKFDAARRFVVSANLKRRHLSTSQRSMIGGRMANMPEGRNWVNLPSKNSREDAARLLNVSSKSVTDARAVLGSGDDDLIAKVDRGEVAVSKAAKEVRATKPKPTKETPSSGAKVLEVAPKTIAEWAKLPAQVQHAYLSHRNPKATLNQQEKGEDDNSIDWAKWTWNPVTGCLHDCPYCYARDIAERFSGQPAYPNGFAPTLRADRLSAPLNGIPRKSDDPRDARIFTGSMT